MRIATVLGSLVLVGCAADRIDVADNELGIVALQIDRADHVFELRGLDAADHQLGWVRLRTGELDELSDSLGGIGDLGSEITISFAGRETRTITRETQLFQLPPRDEPMTQRFLELPEVRAALEQAHIHTLDPADPGEAALFYQNCPTEYLNNTPVVGQCCYSGYDANGTAHWTQFINPTGVSVQRMHNPFHAKCRASDGLHPCSGTACYYGPNAFSRPMLTSPPPGSPYGRVELVFGAYSSWFCGTTFYPSPQTPIFPGASGTFPAGQGCPGGGDGAGEWDY